VVRAAEVKLKAADRWEQLGHSARQVFTSLEQEGCPLCREVAGHDDEFFFWFFNENYFEPFTLDALTQSLGFCLTHSSRLLATTAGSYALAAVHRVLVARAREALAGELTARAGGDSPRLTRTADCPVCLSRDEVARRVGFWLGRGLDQFLDESSYGRPGTVCLPHLRVTLRYMSDAIIRSFLRIHRETLTDVLKTRLDVAQIAGSAEATGGSALRLCLDLAVGHRRPTPFPPAGGAEIQPRAKDPIGDLVEALARKNVCPVCLEVRRAWVEWLQWTERAVRRGDELADVLPSCHGHVWGFVDAGSPELAVAVTRHALTVAAGTVGLAVDILDKVPSPPPGRPLVSLDEKLFGPARRLRRTRAEIARMPECPVCRRLAVASERLLQLLFALMEDRHHGSTIEGGYVLCVQHLGQALSLGPPLTLRRALLEIEASRLATLEWELEESLRKSSWSWRPEAMGREASSWSRAVVKFSGSSCASPKERSA
jgi:hypothetical protein